MRFYERVASALIGTPFQGPAEKLRWVMGFPDRARHPELREIHLECGRIAALMKGVISSGMNCMDVGCHLGSVLDKIVRLSPHGRHIAVEPLAYKAAWLRRKFPTVDVHQIALGDENGSVDFFFNPRMSGFSSLRGHKPAGTVERTTVACKRLDDIVSSDWPIGFLKIDVEGGELLVLRGARRMIAENRPIILFECTRGGLLKFGFSPNQVFSFFADELGYRVFVIRDWLSGSAPLRLSDFETSMTFPFRAFNYVAAPRAIGSRFRSTAHATGSDARGSTGAGGECRGARDVQTSTGARFDFP